MKTCLAPIFTDHAVLQRGKELNVWGSCVPGSTLQLLLLNSTLELSLGAVFEPEKYPIHILSSAKFTVSENHFIAQMPAVSQGGPYRLVLMENNRVCQVLTDIMVGEVWLAGGQSNMEYEIRNDADYSGSICANIRYYQTTKRAFFDDEFYAAEQSNHWMLSDHQDFGIGSAVAIYYAAELSKSLDCCVGIIGCNWGGTSAAAWQSKASLLAGEQTKEIWQEYEALLSFQSPEAYEQERLDYLAYQDSWQPKINEFYANHPTGTWEEALEFAGPCKWPGPMGPKHEFRPCGLYETMLQRVVPYSLKGFLYYQGESDDHHPQCYRELLQSMMRNWRKDFADSTLHFLLVQLPMHRYRNDVNGTNWPTIRQAQLEVSQMDPYTSLAVIIDQGEFDNIHPTHKKEVAHRLYLQAMATVYHKISLSEANGPIFKSATLSSDNKLLLSFDFAQAGFDRSTYDRVLQVPSDQLQNALTTFEVSDETGTFYPATAHFGDGDTCIFLDLPETVTSPKALRYLWINYSRIPLFDKKGMPLAPFFTDLS